MKTSELFEIRYNKPKPKVERKKVYVSADAHRARPEANYDSAQGKFVETGKHYKWKNEKVKDAEGNQVMARPTYDKARYREKSPKSQGGAYSPAAIMGTVGEWLNLMGADVSHIAPAIAKVRASAEYKHLLSLGFEEKSSEGDLNNGTLNFIGDYEPPIGDDHRKPITVRRKILANGNIRTYAGTDYNHAGRGQAPHPFTIKTDPHSTPVDRIAKSMRASIEVVAKTYQVQAGRHFMRALKNR